MSNQHTKEVREGESLSYYIQTQNKRGEPINIPVIDVRDGIAERMLGEQIIKAQNRSRFIPYSRYHESRKNQN